MTITDTPQISTLNEGINSTPEIVNLLETMTRSIRIAVRKTLDSGGKFDLSNPDLTLDAISLRRKLNIDSVRTVLRTQFYLAISINDPSQDPLFCLQKVATSGDLMAINTAYDYFEYKSPEWKILYNALMEACSYNKAFENLPNGSKESIFVANKIAETKDPAQILEAFKLAEKDSKEEFVLGESLILTESIDHIVEAFKLVYSDTYLSVQFARTIKQFGSDDQKERALALSKRDSHEYDILASN